MTFPLKTAGCLSHSLLLLDADDYLFSVSRSFMPPGNPQILLDLKNPGSQSNFTYLSSWVSDTLQYNNSKSPKDQEKLLDGVLVRPSPKSFQRLVGTLVLQLKENDAQTNDAVVAQVFSKNVVLRTLDVTLFNSSLKSSKLEKIYQKSTNFFLHGWSNFFGGIANKSSYIRQGYWISSSEANTFYILDIVDTNSTLKGASTAKLIKYSVGEAQNKFFFTPEIGFVFCYGAQSENGEQEVYLVPENKLKFFEKNCKLEGHLFSSIFSPSNPKWIGFTGFTDGSHFYFFGPRSVTIFRNYLNTSKVDLRVVQKPLKTFFVGVNDGLVFKTGSGAVFWTLNVGQLVLVIVVKLLVLKEFYF